MRAGRARGATLPCARRRRAATLHLRVCAKDHARPGGKRIDARTQDRCSAHESRTEPRLATAPVALRVVKRRTLADSGTGGFQMPGNSSIESCMARGLSAARCPPARWRPLMLSMHVSSLQTQAVISTAGSAAGGAHVRRMAGRRLGGGDCAVAQRHGRRQLRAPRTRCNRRQARFPCSDSVRDGHRC